ncbi:MAG: NAD(P)H-hydrate dehydratase [Candidatus Hodarchaeales archaeon]|jgi:NAD(P)H-hydrate epimerase
MTVNKDEITTETMTILDINSEYFGISRFLLMENAGAQISRFVEDEIKKFSSISAPRIAIFCGTGGNGGDGFVAARHLHANYDVDVFYCGPEGRIQSKSALKNIKSLKKLPRLSLFEIRYVNDLKSININSYSCIIDGLLGTGLRHSKLREPIKSIIALINKANNKKTTFTVSIDVPSGLKRDGNQAELIVKADYTIALHKPKLGSFNYGNQVKIMPIGIPPEASEYCGPGLFTLFPTRSLNSHKGQNGKILIIGGSREYHGAPVLAAKAALALTTDLVTLFVPKIIDVPVRSLDPAYIVNSYEGDFFNEESISMLEPLLPKVDTVLLGPGIGQEIATKKAIQILLKKWDSKFPKLVIDAEALKALKGVTIPSHTILTPHAGEFSLITESEILATNNLDDRLEQIKNGIKDYPSEITWLVKGPIDIIVQDEKYRFNKTGIPVMTMGGTGDVLAGVTTALLSRVIDSFDTASMAAFITGIAGKLVQEKQFSVQKLINYLPIALHEIRQFNKEETNNLNES